MKAKANSHMDCQVLFYILQK